MPTFSSLFSKAYWTLATVGIIWAMFIGCLIHPKVQRQYVYLKLDETRDFVRTIADGSA